MDKSALRVDTSREYWTVLSDGVGWVERRLFSSVLHVADSAASFTADVPDEATDFLEFVHIVRHYREGASAPTVLHCRSAIRKTLICNSLFFHTIPSSVISVIVQKIP